MNGAVGLQASWAESMQFGLQASWAEGCCFWRPNVLGNIQLPLVLYADPKSTESAQTTYQVCSDKFFLFSEVNDILRSVEAHCAISFGHSVICASVNGDIW